MARNVGPVQVAMAGLYGMLGVKDGSNPDVITGFVQPTLDATPWWLRSLQEQLSIGASINCTGAPQSVLVATVPNNEWWFIRRAVAIAQMDITTVAAGFYVRFLILEPVLPAVYYSSPAVPLMVDAAGNVYYQRGPGASAPQVSVEDLWVPPGYRIFIEGQGDATNPDTITVHPLYGVRARI